MSDEFRQKIFGLIKSDFEISRGHPQPFGTALRRGGINFAIYAPDARFVSLVLFRKCATEVLMEFPLDPDTNRTGNVWHALIKGLDAGMRYGYRVFCKEKTTDCNEDIILLDPYTRATCGGELWNKPLTIQRNGHEYTFRLSLLVDNVFDWENDRAPRIPLQDSIFYELHVRGFTRHPSAKVEYPGTFAGLSQKIPYLKILGITAVELMPVTDFDETYPERINPDNKQRLLNFWGYDPLSFFAPKASYATNGKGDKPIKEFKQMVKDFHKAGIEVILDMVFNHTGEGSSDGPSYHFKGLAPSIYYLLDEDGKFQNYSGCGNTLNCNHPIVRDMILDSLRYWVTEMHVDGFRFDLASILGRGRDGSVLANPPLIERIAEDPILADTKLIAEAWDAAGLYQVGEFPHFDRWMEWNGKFRDDARRFIRGEKNMISSIATRLAGSADLYEDDGREPFHSVNFVTCHDGFTMYDLVSYNDKHNQANGEANQDGSDFNLSWNCGIEGPTDDPVIQALRARQIRNHACVLLLAQGVPMLLAGDEFGRSQQGNNNPYCQDNDISWVDWNLIESNADLFRFFQILIAFRKEQPMLHRTRFEVDNLNGQPEMSWHGLEPYKPDWSDTSTQLALLYATKKDANCIYIMMNMSDQTKAFNLPSPSKSQNWYLKLDTTNKAPLDIYEADDELLLKDQSYYALSSRGITVLISK